MCIFCRLNKDNINYHELASKTEGNMKGFKMVMQRNDNTKIEKSEEVVSDSKELISYIKAYHYEFGKLEDADNIAVQINYCPFCGEKL